MAMGKGADSIEDILLQHSKRGMDVLRTVLPPAFVREAAEEILSWERGVVLVATGFYVAGHAETDGPLGAMVLVRALRKLDFRPVIVTDAYCRDFFEPDQTEVVYMGERDGEAFCQSLLQRYAPVGMLSIERCGRNLQGDYANMRGVSIAEHTARIDLLFELADGTIPTIGIGDGGNEIGMGRVKDIICDRLSLVPCVVCTGHLVIATVSNWGGYGLAAYLAEMTGDIELLAGAAWVEERLERIVALGAVDGVFRENVTGVDGFAWEVEERILSELAAHVIANG